MHTIRALGRRAAVVLVALAMVALTAQASYTHVRTEPVHPGGVGVDAANQKAYGEVDDFKAYAVVTDNGAGVYQETNGCNDVQQSPRDVGGEHCEADAECVAVGLVIELAVPATDCSVDPLLP